MVKPPIERFREQRHAMTSGVARLSAAMTGLMRQNRAPQELCRRLDLTASA